MSALVLAGKPRIVQLQVGEDHLEQFLRADPIKCVEELVWNALDAEATLVSIEIDENSAISGVSEIRVIDNGHGLDPELCAEFFGYQGNSWKKSQHRSKNGLRPVHGRNGEGRLYALGLSATPCWSSVFETAPGTKVKTVVTASRATPNRCEILPSAPSDEPTGTRIELPALQVSADTARHPGVLLLDSAPEKLMDALAAYLLAFPDSVVRYRGAVLDPKKQIVGEPVELELTFRHEDCPDLVPTLAIYEWTRERPGKSIFLCTEDAVALAEVPLSKAVRVRSASLTCYVKWAGFRQLGRLEVPEVPYREMIDEVERHLSDYVTDRENRLLGSAEAQWRKEETYPWKSEPTNLVEQAERDLFAVVATVARRRIPKKLDDRKTVFALLRATLESNPSSLSRIIKEVLRLEPAEQADLDELLNSTSLSKIISMATEVARRLDTVRMLESMIYGPLADDSNERDNIHPLVAENPWLFGDEWSLLTSEVSLKTLLTKHLPQLGEDAVLEHQLLGLPAERKRVDVVLERGFQGEGNVESRRLVVELKSPSVVLGRTEAEQIEEYARLIVDDPSLGPTKWDFLLVGKKIDEKLRPRLSNTGLPPGVAIRNDRYKVEVLEWGEQLDRVRRRLIYIQKELALNDSPDEAMARLSKKRTKWLPVMPTAQTSLLD